MSRFPTLTASPSGVSPSLVTAPTVVRVVEVYVIVVVSQRSELWKCTHDNTCMDNNSKAVRIQTNSVLL